MRVIKLFFLILCGLHLSSSLAIIQNYQLYVHPERKDQIHLFSDFHMDLTGTEKTTEQVEQLHTFIKHLSGPKEVIVEDRPTLVAEIEGKTAIERCYSWVESMPRGRDYALLRITPFCYATLGYGLNNIPVHNCELRHPGPLEQGVKDITQYNDHPILDAYYQKAIAKYKSTNETKTLLDARILHRLHQNSAQNHKAQVVIAGIKHTENITPIIEQLGYRKIAYQGISALESEKMEHKHIDEIFTLAEKNEKINSTMIKQEMDEIYQNMINTIAADLSNLSKISNNALAEYEAKSA